MKRYDDLINKACECIIKATDARIKGDVDMQKFWNNAYEGFVIKASKMMSEEGTDEAS